MPVHTRVVVLAFELATGKRRTVTGRAGGSTRTFPDVRRGGMTWVFASAGLTACGAVLAPSVASAQRRRRGDRSRATSHHDASLRRLIVRGPCLTPTTRRRANEAARGGERRWARERPAARCRATGSGAEHERDVADAGAGAVVEGGFVSPRATSTSATGNVHGKDPRTERLAQLQRSYNQRRTPPPLPPGYRVVIEAPNLAGSTKTRLVVVYGGADDPGERVDSGDGADERAEQETRGDVVGWTVVWRKGNDASTLFVSSLEVKKEHRRRGLASRLLHEAEAYGAKRGCDEVSLTVVKTNKSAIALYSRQGYVIDNGGEENAVGKFAKVVMDPQRILQHRMSKPLEWHKYEYEYD